MKKPIFLCLIIIFVSTHCSAENATILNSVLASQKAAQHSNKAFNIASYKGKVVYLDFWASWCIPCRKSFPWMNKIQSKFSVDDFVVVTINVDKKRKLAEDFLKEYPANFKIFYDPKGDTARKYQIKGMPSSILFDVDGKPVIAHKGFFSKKIPQYETEIKNVLASSPHGKTK